MVSEALHIPHNTKYCMRGIEHSMFNVRNATRGIQNIMYHHLRLNDGEACNIPHNMKDVVRGINILYVAHPI